VGDLRKQPKVHRERLLQQVRVRKRMDRIVECSRKLLKTYEDVDGARKDEMASMTGTEAFKVFCSLGALFCILWLRIRQVFYDKLADIKEYHRKFSSVTYETGASDAAVFDPQEFLSNQFSGDEVFGK
jgi:hypothetical protein